MATAANFDSSSSSDAGGDDRGYSFEFVDEKNPENFTCVICQLVIRDLVETGCGHVGCKYCIEEWEKRKFGLAFFWLIVQNKDYSKYYIYI